MHLIDTGDTTGTGGRIRRLRPQLGDATFMITYGDGVSNVDLRALLEFHRAHGRLATVTAVRPPARFGGIVFEGDLVVEFTEKPQIGEGWINGGFLVFEPGLFDYLEGDDDEPRGRCRSRAWPKADSSSPTVMTTSGSAWTRLRDSTPAGGTVGSRARHPGGRGMSDDVLA